jgi:hypothetical protein
VGAGGYRCGQHPGEDAGPTEQSAALEAVVEGRGGECMHEWQSGGVEGEAHRGWPWRRGGSLRCRPARARACGGLAALNRRWAASLGADEDRPAHGFVSEGTHAMG